MTQDRNVEILRLAPYNCELNRIELIWADSKETVARKKIALLNWQTSISSFKKLLMAQAPQNRQHVTKKSRTEMRQMDININLIIINLGETSSENDWKENVRVDHNFVMRLKIK